MSKVSNMKMKDIIHKVGILMSGKDMVYYCKDINAIGEFYKLYQGGKMDNNSIEEFFLKYENEIDKEKFLLILIRNYKNIIKRSEEQLQSINSSINKEEYFKLKIEIDNEKENLKQALLLGKGMKVNIPNYYFDEKNNRYELEIIDSQELIDGANKNNAKKLREFHLLDEYVNSGKKDNENDRMEYILRKLDPSDLIGLFYDEELGKAICRIISENSILEEGIETNEQLMELKRNKEKFLEFVEGKEYKNFYSETKEILEKYVKYLDLRRLAMISAYRLEDELERKNIKSDELDTVKDILEGLLKYIKDNRIEIEFILQDNKTGKNTELKYSSKNVEQCISRFTSNSYLKKSDIEIYREKINSQEITLNQLNSEFIDKIYSNKELELIATLNEENFKYVSAKLGWKKAQIVETLKNMRECSTETLYNLIDNETLESKDIVELYMIGVINLTQIHNIMNNIDLSKEVNSRQLNQYYNDMFIQKDNTENIEDFNKYLELYKTVLLESSSQNLELHSGELMEQIVEDYNEEKREEYIQKVENYYKNGLITLNSILDWDDENILTKLYNDKLVSLEDMQELVRDKKISCKYFIEKYNEIIWDKNVDYDDRVKYIKTGYVSEDEIFNLYENNLIFEEDIKELSKMGLVSASKLQNLINGITREQLEKKSNIRLGNLNRLSKRNNDIYSNKNGTEYLQKNNQKPKLIIDPNERAEFISLFKACKADAILDTDNSFYNYEFYVIPDESGDIGLNSVVIAERYYEDKDTESRFATNNATYFFKYKDLMVLSNLKKSDLIKERKNIVFTANHTIATDKKDGKWAVNVFYAIAKTMLSSDLKEYSQENKRKIILEKLGQVYSGDEIMKILDKAIDIDLGEYNCEIEDSWDRS